MEKDMKYYIDLVRKDRHNIKDIPEEILIAHPEICMEAVQENGDALEYISEEVQIAHPEICMEAVKLNWWVLEFVPDEVQMAYPEVCIEAVQENGYAIEYVSEEIQMAHPEICIKAVQENGFTLEYVSEEVKMKHLEMCMEAVKQSGLTLKYVPEEIKMKHLEICMEAVQENGHTLKYVPKEVQIVHPEICMEAVKQDGYVIDEDKIDEDEEYELKKGGYALKYVPKEVQMAHPEICIEAVKQDGDVLQYVPVEVRIAYPEICMEAVKQDGFLLEYDVPKEVQMAHPEICMEVVKQSGWLLHYIPVEVRIAYPEICMEAVKQDGDVLERVPEEVRIAHPEICMEAVKQYGSVLKYVPEEVQIAHLEICIEAMKNNIESYKLLSPEVKNIDKIQKFMFEDVDRIKRIKEKANFNISENYDEEQMDIFYHQMIKSIGIEEVEKLVEIPKLTKEEVEKCQLEYSEKFKELFEKRYKITGELGAVVEIINGINVGEYSQKGKNARYEIYKNINRILEEKGIENKRIEEIVKEAIKESGYEVKEGVIEKLEGRKKEIVRRLAEERIVKTRGKLEERLEELESQQEPVRRIIEKKIKESMEKGEGRYTKEEIIEKIGEEIKRRRENGNMYYSPHIVSQEEKIKEIVRRHLEDKGIERELNKGIVEIIKGKKEEIGKGWIRKILTVPREFGEKEYENLEKSLGIKLETTYEVGVKEGVEKEKAYELLKEKQVKGVITYEQVEAMFSKMHEPYSEKFKEYYKGKKEEILEDPEIYMELSRMHNNFENIIKMPEVRTRYEAGKLKPEDIVRILKEQKYENVRRGNERLAEIASRAGVGAEYFEVAQEIFEKTKKREGSRIPQVKVDEKRYRGRILRADDPLNIVVGNITTCCQVIGDVGEGSMIHASTEKNGAIFVVEKVDEKGKVEQVVAQSWTWRNKDRMCYDNIEIRENIGENLSKEEEKEIMEIYIKAGKKAIEQDEKMMGKLLEEGKISRRVYDEVVLKEVTCGVGYNDLGELTRRVEEGSLKKAEKIVVPKESEKIYKGYKNRSPWIDSKESQIVLASMEERKKEEIERRKKEDKEEANEEEIGVIYKNVREEERHKGKEIHIEDIERIKRIEKEAYRSEQQIMQECMNAEDVAQTYGLNVEDMEIITNKENDWYMIGEEEGKEYYIADLAMLNGVNSNRNEGIKTDAKMATFEVAKVVYEKLIEMAEKGKKVRYEATRDTSYINTKRMEEKGLIEIEEDEEGRFGNSKIEMNNVIIKPNKEKLEEELKKIKETLKKLEEREVRKTVELEVKEEEESR